MAPYWELCYSSRDYIFSIVIDHMRFIDHMLLYYATVIGCVIDFVVAWESCFKYCVIYWVVMLAISFCHVARNKDWKLTQWVIMMTHSWKISWFLRKHFIIHLKSCIA